MLSSQLSSEWSNDAFLRSFVVEMRMVTAGSTSLEVSPFHPDLQLQPFWDWRTLFVLDSNPTCALQSGKVKADPTLGRLLADTVKSVPSIPPEELEQLVADDAQDALLIMYLANLVRTQLALADRLGTAALPLL